MNRLRLTLLLALSALSACTAGGQTGDEDNFECPVTRTALALDSVSPLGFSPQDLLTLASGPFAADMIWRSAPTFPYGPESGVGRISFRVISAREARFLDYIPRPNTSGIPMPCQDQVELDVTAELKSDGGALDERFDAVLAGQELGLAQLFRSFQPAELQGTFAFQPAALTGSSLVGFSADIRFGLPDFSGAFEAGFQQSSAATTSFQRVPLSCWPVGCAP